MFGKILVGIDGSSGADRALKGAIDLAARYEATLEAISIVEKTPRFATSISEAKMLLDREREYFEDLHRNAQLEAAKRHVEFKSNIMPGHEVTTMLDFAKSNKFDLLIIGKQGLSTKGARRAGTTARALAEDAPCPILIM